MGKINPLKTNRSSVKRTSMMRVRKKTRCSPFSWPTLCAVMFYALGPLLPHLSSSAFGQNANNEQWVTICTHEGIKFIPSNAGSSDDGGPLDIYADCFFCVICSVQRLDSPVLVQDFPNSVKSLMLGSRLRNQTEPTYLAEASFGSILVRAPPITS